MEYKTLNNGLKMPMVGLGVFNIPECETPRVVEDALSVGYRSIDTAAMYSVDHSMKQLGLDYVDLTKIVDKAKVLPVVNQCETHVFYQQRKMLEYLKPYGVELEAWSPLAEGKHGIFKNPTLAAIGEKYGKTAAQIALKFLIQKGLIIIPKTTHKERMIENISIFDFTLSDDDLQSICHLDTGRNVTGWPSDALTYKV